MNKYKLNKLLSLIIRNRLFYVDQCSAFENGKFYTF